MQDSDKSFQELERLWEKNVFKRNDVQKFIV